VATNPNWPIVEHAWGTSWGANAGALPYDKYVNLNKRTNGSVATSRGRQYELDQVQAGTLGLTLANTDSALDPTNTSGPWFGHIAPFQPFRVRMQYPPTANLLTAGQATGGEGFAAGSIPASLDVLSSTDTSGGTITASASAYQGANVFQFAVPNATAVASTICYTSQPAAKPGQAYTMQMQVRNVTAATSIQVRPHIAWLNAAGASTRTYGSTVTLTGSTSAAWTQITVTATIPAGAYGMTLGVSVATLTTAATSVQVDGWQLEEGSAASAFTVPGVTYPLYAGFTEKWPSSWTQGGTYGVVTPSAVDAFALLSQRQLRDPLTEEIYSRNPRFVYTFGDPQGSNAFADSTGNNPPAPQAVSKYGAGSLTSGNQITATDPVNGIYTGGTGTVVSVANQYPGTNFVAQATYISLNNAGIAGPKDPTVWTRMLAFRYTGPMPTGSGKAVIWSAMDGSANSQIYLQINSGSGAIGLQVGGPTGISAGTATGNVVDGNWHLVIFGYNKSTNQFLLALDGNLAAYLGGVDPLVCPTGLTSDCLGAFVDASVGNGTTYTFQGDIAYAAEFPVWFKQSDFTAMYQAWKNSFTGDSTDARYARILKWAGYTGPTSIATGATTSMGPFEGGQDALSALQSVVDTENGNHFVAADGTVTFTARTLRYNSLTPVYTFGERGDLGEYPYEEVQLDYDSTHLGNIITVTQASTNQTFTAADAASQNAYFPRTLSRTVSTSNPLECQDAANYLLSRYKDPKTRVQALRLSPGTNPALWPVCLSLELGTRIRVMKRPFGGQPIQLDCFVEHISWTYDDQNNAAVDLQCSPVDPTPYGLVGALHTTLNAQANSGTGSLTLNAGADNANPLAAQIGINQQLVIEPGSANQEIVTISAVGTTSSGWSTGTVTLSANLTKTHAANSVVSDVLPTGVTSPTTWDSVDKFDSEAFSY